MHGSATWICTHAATAGALGTSAVGMPQIASSDAWRCRCGSTVTSHANAAETSFAKLREVMASPGRKRMSWRMYGR
jgi:hypothetical protein